jgi:hypothetical protein
VVGTAYVVAENVKPIPQAGLLPLSTSLLLLLLLQSYLQRGLCVC